ncbi:pyridoxal phosphate-dependent enzyme, beta subunit [Serendipita vermifera]|nr:pyridoxal phosphate-dependent enzyme, beta subunit [Serendipita vermifera]
MPLAEGILDSALDAIGHTPLIRLDRIARTEGFKCNLLAKVEFLSVGGSVKDRIAKRMVEEAERVGRLVPGKSTVIEATSGNTGIGLGLACAIKGYPLIITLPAKMSLEKEATLRALGAEIVRTPTEAAWDSPESHIGVAKRLQKSIPNSVILNQYSNEDNPLAHEYTTGPEIIDAIVADYAAHSYSSRKSSGKVDVVVMGAGTGGTITGVSRAIKKVHNPDCLIVGVDPKGSVLAYPDSLNKTTDDSVYQVEGIGYDFVPEVLDRLPSTVDKWLKIGDDEAFPATMRLIKEEALLVGGSSGTALAGALNWLRSPEGKEHAATEGKNVVVILPDGIRNYMSKPWFLSGATQQAETPLSKVIKQTLASN